MSFKFRYFDPTHGTEEVVEGVSGEYLDAVICGPTARQYRPKTYHPENTKELLEITAQELASWQEEA